jgi:hypothetical protein
MSRTERIAYPALSWLAAAGRVAAVPVTLVLVNVVALGVLAGTGASLSRSAGRSPIWGLIIPAYWGSWWSLSRDLTEVVAAAFVAAGVIALRRQRPVLAGLSLAGGVLSRETVLGVVGAILLSRVIGHLRKAPRDPAGQPRTPRRVFQLAVSNAAWTLPLIVFFGWQLAVYAVTGLFPLRVSGQANIGTPFVGIGDGISRYVQLLPSTASLLWCGEFVVLIVLVGLAARFVWSCSAPLHERIAWVVYLVLAICLAKAIWLGDVGFRSLDEIYFFSCLVLLSSRISLRIPAAVVGTVWFVVAVELILFV